MAQKVRFQDLARLHETIRPELMAAFDQMLATSAFIQGPFVQTFEKDFATFTGAAHCLGVANGTDALELALEALGIGVGDTVLVPALTFTATAEAVVRVGAKPVFVDADPETLCSEAPQFATALRTSPAKPKAMIAVHLHGRACRMDELVRFSNEQGLVLIEDCAQSHGARFEGRHTGLFGAIGTFSFYPGKNLGALGDAGAIITQSAELAAKIRLLRDHGRTQKYLHEQIGRNSRLDGLQAAFLSVKLKRLPEWTRRRQEIATSYARDLRGIAGLTLPVLPSTADGHVFHNFVVQVPGIREKLMAHLNEQGVESGVHYPIGLHAQPAFASQGPFASFPVTEQAAGASLSLPIDPLLPELDRIRVVEAVREFFERR